MWNPLSADSANQSMFERKYFSKMFNHLHCIIISSKFQGGLSWNKSSHCIYSDSLFTDSFQI